MSVEIIHGDCLSAFKDVRGLASIVTDPPGGGSFMGLAFDRAHGGRDGWIANMAQRFKVAREATERGAWGLFWSFPRTAHWTACALDDAGWDVVSCIEHVHGQGWPKGRSQLKPAKEIWWLVRWGGVTPLQIDRCRVRRSAPLQAHNGTDKGYGGKRPYTPGDAGKILQDAGSWPPDLVLTHAPACREVGSRTIAVRRAGGIGLPKKNAVYGQGIKENLYYDHPAELRDGCKYMADETLPAWSCLAACTCGLASLSPAGGAPERCPGCGEERWWCCPVAELEQESDGASRFFPTFGGHVSTLYCPSCLDVSLRGGTSTSAMAGGIGSGANRGAESSYSSSKTDGFGNERTGLSPKDARSTTKTRTRPTTGSKTSNASPLPSMTPNMPSPCPTCGAPMVRWSDAAASAMSGNQWPSTSQDPQGHSTDTANRAALSHSENGGRRMPNTGTPTDEHGMPWGYHPSFHYDAKASARERQAGCEGLLWVKDKAAPIGWRRVSAEDHTAASEKDRAQGNVHATIKPIGCGEDDGLMRWLIRLITPPGGKVGDPFLGSGSTAVAAQIEGHDFLGCDIDPGAVDIARTRAAHWTLERHQMELRTKRGRKTKGTEQANTATEQPQESTIGTLVTQHTEGQS